MNFQLEVVGINGKIFSGEVEEVTLPGIFGELTALARHMPIVTPLTVGEVAVKTPERVLSFSIGKGIFAFEGGLARLLIEDVTSADEISEMRALEAKKKAEELLAKGVKGEEKLAVIYQLRKSLVDLKIVRRKKKVL
jgi:F-type H+-transporting ATPase subunit epsilon